MNERQHWFWHCLLGTASVAFFGLTMAAIEQRDEARRLAKPTVELSGTTLVVSCPKPIQPAAASGTARPQPRFIL